MRGPSVRQLGPELQRAAIEIDRRLRRAGHEAWIVGGAVRDLALERPVGDLDVATDATPDELVELFEHTHSVGRAFGTIVVVVEGAAVEVTTFRRESGYSDARRPDRVEFGRSAAEDAKRRDFTVNALYLSAHGDELFDPTGGWDDLVTRRLRAVGGAAVRFREDGLRIVRLARFAATLGFAIEPETGAAARRELPSLRGVSPERVLGEWERGFDAGAGAALVRALAELDALTVCLHGLAELCGSPAELERRVAALERLECPPTLAVALALLCEARPGDDGPSAQRVVDGLRPSRELARAVQGLWGTFERLRAAAGARPSRSRVVRLAREPACAQAIAALLARARAGGEATGPLDELRAALGALSPDEVAEPRWLDAADLAAAGIEPGPAFGALLAEAEDRQLDRDLADRDDARRWLAERAAQLGGNQRPNT